jgi:hypothetical protein
MYIAKFQINNYKSFLSSQEINLTPGFNVVVGQNNAGKSAFVEALSLHFSDRDHISMKTVPSPGMHLHDSSTSSVQIAFKLAEQETEQLLINARGTFYLPIKERPDLENAVPEFLALLHQPGMLQCVYQSGRFAIAYLESLGEIKDVCRLGEIRVNTSQRQLEGTQNFYNIGQMPSYQFYGPYLANILRERIYIFRAERLNVSQSTFGTQTVLASDASNLAEVLHHLQSSNITRFRRFNQHISTIFPEIRGITVPPGPGDNQVRILVWSIDPDTERSDLAIPLSESGTGIGQV